MTTAQLAIDFDKAREARETGIERAGEHADRVEDGWRYQALALLTAFARRIGRPFLIEEARAWAHAEPQGLPMPPTAKSWGSVARIAAAKKRIKKLGFAPAASSNCSPKTLWVSL